VATDLNEPMIVYAQQKGFGDSGLEWRRADATKLPFEDTSFGGMHAHARPRAPGTAHLRCGFGDSGWTTA